MVPRSKRCIWQWNWTYRRCTVSLHLYVIMEYNGIACLKGFEGGYSPKIAKFLWSLTYTWQPTLHWKISYPSCGYLDTRIPTFFFVQKFRAEISLTNSPVMYMDDITKKRIGGAKHQFFSDYEADSIPEWNFINRCDFIGAKEGRNHPMHT